MVWANKRLRDLGVASNKKCYQTFNNLVMVCPDCGVKKVFEHSIGLDIHEFETVDAKGEKAWIELRVTPLKDKNGNVTEAIELAVPITGRKKIENYLVEKEEHFRVLAEESPNMIFINHKGRVVYANKKCEEITGYTREEFYSSNFSFLSLCPPEYIEKVKSAYAKHLKGEMVPPYEYVLITRVGDRINAIINTSLIEYKGSMAILGIITDITERKKKEKELQESELKYRSIFSNSEVDMFRIKIEDSEILEFNDKHPSIFGLTHQEIRGKQSFSFWADPLEWQEMICQVQANNYVKDFECKMLNKQHEIRQCVISARLYPGEGILEGSIVDVTERKKTEERQKILERKVKEYSENLKWLVDLRTAQLKDANERL